MSALEISRSLLSESLNRLRKCGNGESECILYWLAQRSSANTVHRIVHPMHNASPFGYRVESDFVGKLFLELRTTNELVRAQVHSHPHEAFHSPIDDEFSLTPSTGFLSLVVPNFAREPFSISTCYLAEVQGDGTWTERDPEGTLVLL